MEKFFQLFLAQLGKPSEQKTENVALAVVYCLYLSFATVLVALLILL
jgi:hypothetical protein